MAACGRPFADAVGEVGRKGKDKNKGKIGERGGGRGNRRRAGRLGSSGNWKNVGGG